MAEPEAEVDRLRRELADIEAEFWKAHADLAMGWQFVLGPLRVRRYASPMFIAQVFVLFHVLCFAAGAAFIFTAGPTRELGIAMVVGSIFAFGSFVAQFWAISYERFREIAREATGDQGTMSLKRLAARRRLRRRLDLGTA
jgi:hypothetical protein